MYKLPTFILGVLFFLPVHAELPCTYDSDLQADMAEVEELEQELAQRKEIIRTRKILERNKEQQLKKQQRETNKRLRLQLKCKKVTQQIDRVNERMRTGYTIEQGKALNRKLAEYKEERRKVCKHE